MVSAGAKVLGSITIGANSKIGAGSVVLNDVPANSTVVGVPGKVVRSKDERLDCVKLQRSEMDQIHLPDPVETEICELKQEIEDLKNVVIALTNETKKPEKNRMRIIKKKRD